jgi:hypothetical protein
LRFFTLEKHPKPINNSPSGTYPDLRTILPPAEDQLKEEARLMTKYDGKEKLG